MELIVTGYAGLEGSRIIYQNETCQNQLRARYADTFLQGLAENRTETDEAARLRFIGQQTKAAENGMLCSAAEGGIFAALWNLLRKHHTGAAFSQRKIPVLQQTIEVCETFGLNPYRLHAPGCAVWLCTEPGALLADAARAEVPAAWIGSTRKGAGILREDGAEIAYLRRPEPDELEKLYAGKLEKSVVNLSSAVK